MELETLFPADGVALVRVRGELDLSHAGRLRATLVDLLDRGYRALGVNLNQVSFIDSSGVGVLVGGLKRTRERQGRYVLICTSAQVLRVFEITGLQQVFDLYSDEQEALESLSGGDS